MLDPVKATPADPRESAFMLKFAAAAESLPGQGPVPSKAI
jgi:hypothetical protein